MFLGSGSVIHGMHEEQDIRNMGGLRDKMKITYITFLIGAIAISGIPPFSGFFSKDEILYKTFVNAGIIPYLLVLIAAAFTAFYMFRLIGLTFFGKPRYDANIHPHESTSTMTIPLIILAILSIIGGFIGLPSILGYNVLEHWFEPVFKNATLVVQGYNPETEHSANTEIVLIFVSIIVASIAVYVSFKKYSKQDKFTEERGIGKILENKYYIDEFYDKTVVNPIFQTSERFLWKIFDVKIIDGLVNGIATFASRLSLDWRKVQSGIIHDYATLAVSGIILIILYFLFA
jgi:NADH-quinone oxidoreductase subunit L